MCDKECSNHQSKMINASSQKQPSLTELFSISFWFFNLLYRKFSKVFRTHSAGQLIVASTLFNSNRIKHARFCRIRFRLIFKRFSSNLRWLLQNIWKRRKTIESERKAKAACERPCVGTRKIWTKEN